MWRRFGWALAALLLLAGPGRAADPCADMIRLQAEHMAHARAEDSDVATLNRMLAAAQQALKDCFAQTEIHESPEFFKAWGALEKPRYAVPERAVTWTKAKLGSDKAAYEFSFYVELPDQGKHLWGTVRMPCKMLADDCIPTEDASPNMVIDTRVTAGGKTVIIHIIGDNSTDRLSATRFALRAIHEEYARAFPRHRLERLTGSLQDKNLSNFQLEWATAVYKQRKSPSEASQQAIRAISFGKERMKAPFNYTTFKVTPGSLKAVELKLPGDAAAVAYDVPSKVDVVVSGRK